MDGIHAVNQVIGNANEYNKGSCLTFINYDHGCLFRRNSICHEWNPTRRRGNLLYNFRRYIDICSDATATIIYKNIQRVFLNMSMTGLHDFTNDINGMHVTNKKNDWTNLKI